MDATVTVALKQMYPTVETDDEYDEVDETRDFGSGWRSLGIGRLLVLASVLALFISAGLWMLEAQFKKQEQAARLDPRNAARERPGLSALLKRSRLPARSEDPLQQPAQRSKLQFRRRRQNQRDEPRKSPNRG